jgi:NAD(P)-dependent dehydrogenase (short-subunit alcohol dehydrogenase family)
VTATGSTPATIPHPAQLFDLTGRVALITGGSRGLGREMALAYAKAGADVVVTSRKKDSCDAVVADIQALGRRALAHPCHVGHWDELEPLADAAYAEFGKIDILVNNAGMSPLADSSVATSEELFDKVVGVNFKGPFRLGSLIGSRMHQAGSGSIINVSSTGSIMPQPRFGPYAGAKAALNALTTVLALEFAPTVRVNTLCAGPFLTDIAKAWTEEARESADNALGRNGNPQEIIPAALFLASPQASFTTGAIVRVDGGLQIGQ